MSAQVMDYVHGNAWDNAAGASGASAVVAIQPGGTYVAGWGILFSGSGGTMDLKIDGSTVASVVVNPGETFALYNPVNGGSNMNLYFTGNGLITATLGTAIVS